MAGRTPLIPCAVTFRDKEECKLSLFYFSFLKALIYIERKKMSSHMLFFNVLTG